MLHSRLMGDDLHSPSNEIVENITGSTIAGLRCVKFDGFGTHFPTISIATPLIDVVRGVTQTDILTGKVGIITSLGFMTCIDTSAWGVGTRLYCSAGGVLSTTVLGLPIATVIKSSATEGILYIDNTGITLADISSAANTLSWKITGNAGIDSTNFLGTTDAQPLLIKTNNSKRAVITDEGRVGFGDVDPQSSIQYKFHTGDNATGRLFDTFSVSSITDTYTLAYAITLPLNSTVMVEVDLTSRQSDGLQRAAFKKVGTFNKASAFASVVQDGNTQSSYTQKTHNGFNVRFTTTLNTVVVEIKNANAVQTNWVGVINSTVVTSL